MKMVHAHKLEKLAKCFEVPINSVHNEMALNRNSRGQDQVWKTKHVRENKSEPCWTAEDLQPPEMEFTVEHKH